MPGPKDINSKSYDILTSCQAINQFTDLASIDSLDLLGYTFVINHDDTGKHSEVK